MSTDQQNLVSRIEDQTSEAIEAAIAIGLKYLRYKQEEKFYLYGDKEGNIKEHGHSMNTVFLLAIMRGGYGHDLEEHHKEALKLIFTERAALAGFKTAPIQIAPNQVAYTIGPKKNRKISISLPD